MKKNKIFILAVIIIFIIFILIINFLVKIDKNNKIQEKFKESIGEYVVYCNKKTNINLDNILDNNLKLITYEIDGIFDFNKNEYQDVTKLSYKYTYKYNNKEEYEFKLNSLKKHSIASINSNRKKLEIYEKHFMYTGSNYYFDFYGNYINDKFQMTYQDIYNLLANNGYNCSEN